MSQPTNESNDLNDVGQSDYSRSHLVPWWLYCHKALIYKIWSHKQFYTAMEKFKTAILKEFENNTLKISVQIYTITYYLLLDDLKAFKDGLIDIDRKIKVKHSSPPINGEAKSEFINEEAKITIVENELNNISFHHIDLVFFDNVEKRKKHCKMIQEWLQKKIEQ